MKKNLYEKKERFKNDFEYFQRNGFTFIREYTNYTESLKFPDYTVRYNNEGYADAQLLHIINLVKSDAEKYLKLERVPMELDISWTFLKEIPEQKNFYKVDINSAYWEVAKSRGIISEQTNLKALEYADSLKQLKGESNADYQQRKKERFKYLRTRSIGSLATKKKIEVYKKGLHDWTSDPPPVQDIEKRNLYLLICHDIDVMMKLILRAVPSAFFYYWDCVFVLPEGLEKSMELLNQNGFTCTYDYDYLEVIEISEYRKILSAEVSGKKYNVKPEILY